jgi:hypothetical protein
MTGLLPHCIRKRPKGGFTKKVINLAKPRLFLFLRSKAQVNLTFSQRKSHQLSLMAFFVAGTGFTSWLRMKWALGVALQRKLIAQGAIYFYISQNDSSKLGRLFHKKTRYFHIWFSL